MNLSTLLPCKLQRAVELKILFEVTFSADQLDADSKKVLDSGLLFDELVRREAL